MAFPYNIILQFNNNGEKQTKWYWLQLEVDHKVELSYNSLEDINYLNKNI